MGWLSRIGKMADPLWKDLRADFTPKPPTFAQRAAMRPGETAMDRMARGGTMMPEDAADWLALLQNNNNYDDIASLLGMGGKFDAGAIGNPRIQAMLERERQKRVLEAMMLLGKSPSAANDIL